jgi:hypothetical protein
MSSLIGLGIAVALAILGYVNARRFVRTRLRFVDAIQRPLAPWIAGIATAAIAAPLFFLLPLVGSTTALVLGASVGTGVAHGARDARGGTAGLLEG